MKNYDDYFGDGLSKAPIIHDVKILLYDLRKVSEDEGITLDQAIQLYDCRTKEYLSKTLHDCVETLDGIHKHIIGKD